MSEFVTKQFVASQILVSKLRERAEEGQSMVEYSLLMAFVSIVAIAAMTHLGHDISNLYKHIADSLQADISNTLNNVSNSL
jgi:Flp pilus assembly pilin Flp